MKSIDVQGLPEPVVKAIAEMISVVRRELTSEASRLLPSEPPELPRWTGGPTTPLTREEIYDDAA